MDIKNVEPADGDTLQEERRTTINGSEGDELTSAPIEESDDVPVNDVADMPQFDEGSCGISEKIGAGRDEI